MARPTSLKTVVSRLFGSSDRPIYIVDAAGRIVFCNQALAEWVNVSEEELHGLRCDYQIARTQDDISRCLAVPPQAKELGEYRTTIAMQTSGRDSKRSARFIALHDAGDSMLVILDDVEAELDSSSPLAADTLHRELMALHREWSQAYRLDCVVGQTGAMRQVRAQIRLAADSSCRVVIAGNEGTGRETIARTIHWERTQGQNLLTPLSCELLDAELLQSTIDTLVRQNEEFETGGTLLLLNVDQLVSEAQLLLLEFVGTPECGLQIMATSRDPLMSLVDANRFSAELAHQLLCLEIRLPPLHERLEDIPVLAQWMLERLPDKSHVGGFTTEAMEALLRYGWPNEVSELQATVREAAAKAKGSLVTKDDLPRKFQYAADAAVLPEIPSEEVSLDDFMAEVESELIVRALRQAKGNRAQAARSLGISRGRLLRRIEQLGIEEC